MKTLTLSAIFMSALFMMSCSSDDDNGTDPLGPINAVSGTYNLISFTAPTSEDLNEDGTLSANLVSESACYTEWSIQLNSNRSYTRIEKAINVNDGTINCTGLTDTGTWDIQGNTVTLTQSDGTQLNTTYIYLDANSSLTQTRMTQYPTVFEEIWVLTDASINLVYTKQ